ncbi:MAG: peptide chain release factor N(5)-glutamine methyltransferase [Chloroflexi bacterium]|nr:peptide chain release factor N(5)-glutamine methyltransferase [Chloroflexota bacterium]
MNPREAAQEAALKLAAAGVPEARFEAEVLVRHVSSLSRAQFFAARGEMERPAELDAAVARRAAREPGAYITGTREFYGLPFHVGPGVLVPRPETELLVDLGIEAARNIQEPVIVDVGTGSGCIAVALAATLGRPGATVVATDLSAAALAIARRNRDMIGAPVHFVRASLAGAMARADVILANLPYIPSGEIDALEPEVSRWEPRVALDGGADGLGLIRRLIADCSTRLRPRLLALEVGFGQADAVAALAREAGATVDLARDLAGIDRVVCARWE